MQDPEERAEHAARYEAAGLQLGADGVARCGWCGDDAEYQRYHDEEWGFPVVDDTRLFEKICLEGFQSGLSWLTILRKRENFRTAFSGFDIDVVARFDEADVARLLLDAGIIRHRGKIEATVNNAARARDLIDERGSLAAYVWSYADASTVAPAALSDVPAKTTVSEALAKDLKRRGWRFFGPTTAYAFMQAMGLVNDHVVGCFRRDACEAARQETIARFALG